MNWQVQEQGTHNKVLTEQSRAVLSTLCMSENSPKKMLGGEFPSQGAVGGCYCGSTCVEAPSLFLTPLPTGPGCFFPTTCSFY